MEALLGNWLFTAGVGLLIWVFIKFYRLNRSHVKDLHQKAVLITGCDSGFGHELAKRLDALGVKVYAGVLFPEGDGAARLKEACSSRLHTLHLDVTKDDHVTEAVKTVTSTLGDKKLWAVVNNAGVITSGGFEWTPMEKVKKLMDINAYGPLRVTAAFLPFLKESHGRVVIVASLAGHHSIPTLCAYNMSKHAAVAFGDSIRRELNLWSVSVHLIKPYLYRTNLVNPEFLHKELVGNWETSNILKSSYPRNYLQCIQVCCNVSNVCDGILSRRMQDLIDVCCCNLRSMLGTVNAASHFCCYPPTEHLQANDTYAISSLKKCLPMFLIAGNSEEKLHEVVNDMEDAVIGLHPKVSYIPGFIGKVIHIFCTVVPSATIDFVFSLFNPPLKEDGKNRFVDFLHAAVIKNEKETS